MTDKRDDLASLAAENDALRRRVATLEAEAAERTAQLAHQHSKWAATAAAEERFRTARKHAEEELRQSEEKYRALIEQSSEGIGIARGNEIIYANRALLEILGYEDLDEFRRLPLLDHVAPASRELVRAHMREGPAQPKSRRFEYQILRKDGEPRDLEITSVQVVINGQVFTQSTFRDLTERKRAEQALTASEQEVARLYAGLPGIAFLLRVESGNGYRFVAISRMFVETTGLSRDEIVGRMVHEVIPAPSQALVLARYAEAIRTRAAVHWEEVSSYPTGTLHAKVSVSPVFTASGACTHLAGIVHDLTELKRTEEALRKTEARLSQVIHTTPAAIFTSELHEPFRATFVSGTARENYGYEARSFTEAPDFWASRIHPEDAPRVRSGLHNVLNSGGDGCVHEYRFRQPDGTYRWIHEELRIVRGASGEPIEAVGYGIDVTERKRAEEELRKSLKQLTMVAETTFEGIVESEAGRIVDCNEQIASMLGYAVSELRGMEIATFLPPEDRERVLANILRGQESVIEHSLIRKNSERIIVEAHGRPFSPGGTTRHTAIRDITAHKRIEEELAASRDYLDSLLNAVGNPVFVKDGRHLFVLVNDACCAFLGRSREELIGGADFDFFPRDQAEVFWAKDDAILRAGQADINEELITDRMGRVRTILTRKTLYTNPRGEKFVVGVISDITERKQDEERLRETDRRKSEFLGVLSHELRNPLTPIRNSLYIIERATPGGEQARRAHSVIDRQVSHLTRLVDDLLDVTRISRGKVRLQRTRLDLVEVVRRTVEDHRTLLEDHEVTVALPDSAVWIDGDPARLTQVIGNLLNNAAKFTPVDGRVSVTLTRAGAHAALEVADTGLGLDPETLERLFEPFAQADRSLDRSRGGLGLGLALVKGMVELHGGEVSAHSDGPGRGARFTVKLPLAEQETIAEPLLQHQEAAGRGRKVLVIEDNRDAANSLSEALGLAGHQVAVAYDGDAGLATAREIHPEIVLCDIGLPGGTDGYAVARALRKDPRTASAYLVALTGYAQPEDQRRALEAGFDAHMPKPPDLAALGRLLAEVLTRSAQAGEGAAPPA